MAIRSTRGAGTAHPPGHGRRRQGRLHRRGPPHRGADRRRVRPGRRLPVVRSRPRGGVGGRPWRGAQLRRFRRHGQARGAAQGRHRGGGDRHPQPHARAGGPAVPEARHPRDLRQAADSDPGRRQAACEGGRGFGRALRADPQLYRLSDGAAGAGDGCRRANSARSGWCRSSMRRTGCPNRSRRRARSRPPGAPIPAQTGAGGSTGDIGTHAFNLAGFVTGLEARQPCGRPAELRARAAGRRQRPCPAALQGWRARHAVVQPGGAGQRKRR